MLFRGTTPLSDAERLDYEIRCELERMRDQGLLMEAVDRSTGESMWAKTLRGVLDLRPDDSEKLIRIIF